MQMFLICIDLFKSKKKKMSMVHKIKNTQDDIFIIIEKNINHYFTEIENSVPHFQQTLFELQNEYFKAWKNIVCINISLQKEFTNKTGNAVSVTRETQTIVDIVNGEFAKIHSKQNKAIIMSIETAKQNVIVWNNNVNTFAELNRSIMCYWISLFAPK